MGCISSCSLKKRYQPLERILTLHLIKKVDNPLRQFEMHPIDKPRKFYL